jgi:GYF domain 2
MRDSWYYSVPEGQIGPITLEELKHTLPTLPNAEDVYIWHDSLPDWIRAGDLAEIVAKAKATAPRPAVNEDQAQEPSFDTAAEEKIVRDAPSLDGFHPDRAYSITMPIPTRDDPAVETNEKHGRVGLSVGLGLMLLGCAVFYLGFSGTVAWAERAIGFDNALVEASPGAMLFVVGLLVILARGRRR